MTMRFVTPTLIVLLGVSPTSCSPNLSVQEKACLSAASHLLQSAGAAPQSVSSASPLQASEAAKRIIESFGDPDQAREETLRTFWFMGDSDNQEIKRMSARGDYAEAEKQLKDLLGKWLAAGSVLNIDASSAGVSSTYRFACGWDAAGKVMAAPLGMVR